ncbi:MAG: ADP-ribosylation factor-like protein, partial [Candidatus Odinarchaeota archaeon]
RHLTHLKKEITIFDLGGQINFLERYLGELAKFTFSKVSALVFVVDTANVSELTRVKYYLDMAVERIAQHSPKSPVYILLHKTDLLNQNLVGEICDNMKAFLESDIAHPLTFFQTTVLLKRAESVFTSFSAILGRIASNGELVSLEAEVPVTPVMLLEKFIKNNSPAVKMAQILSANGTPLIGTRDFSHVSKFDARRVLDNALQYMTNHMDVTLSTFFESEDKIHFFKFLQDGKILLLSIAKESISDSIPGMHAKILLLAKKLDEYS